MIRKKSAPFGGLATSARKRSGGRFLRFFASTAELPLDFYRCIVKNTHVLIVLPVFRQVLPANALAGGVRVTSDAVQAKVRLIALRNTLGR